MNIYYKTIPKYLFYEEIWSVLNHYFIWYIHNSDFCDYQNSGSCFLNRHPCLDKDERFMMVLGSCIE